MNPFLNILRRLRGDSPAAAASPPVPPDPPSAPPAPPPAALREEVPGEDAVAGPVLAPLPLPGSAVPLHSALGGIALIHIEHEARSKRVRALARARVAVVGEPELEPAQLEAAVQAFGGALVEVVERPVVVVAGAGAAAGMLDVLRRRGCLVVDGAGVLALAAEYRRTTRPSWFQAAVGAALHRLRVGQAPRERRPVPVAAKRRTAPMVVEPARPHVADALALSIEEHARARRARDPRCRLLDPGSAGQPS